MEGDMVVVEPGDEPPSAAEYDNSPPCIAVPTTDGDGISGYATRHLFAGWEDGGYCTPPWDLEPEQRTSAPFALVRAETMEDVSRPLWPIETERESKVRVSYRDVRGKWHGAWGRHIGATRRGAESGRGAEGGTKQGREAKRGAKQGRGAKRGGGRGRGAESGASRGDDGSRRHHSGVDLYADEGDKVLAAEDGELIAMLPFHHGTWAMYVRNTDGQIANYGEVAKNSWMEFGFPMRVAEGEAVKARAGQVLGRVGLQSGGDTMMHFEMYAPVVTLANIRAGEMSWPFGESAPTGLLDPSRYLVVAQKTWFDQKAEVT